MLKGISVPVKCLTQIFICQILFKQMLEGLVKKIALDFDVLNIAKAAKGSKEAKIAEVGADIELLTKS